MLKLLHSAFHFMHSQVCCFLSCPRFRCEAFNQDHIEEEMSVWNSMSKVQRCFMYRATPT